jgi:hypothetical protein
MKKILCLGCVVICLAVFPSTVSADHYTVSADDFKPGDGTSNMWLGYWGEFVRRNTTAGYLFAPVHLPSGAVVKNMRIMYVDNDAVNDMVIYFSFFNHFTINPSAMNQIDIFQYITNGASGSVRTAVKSTHQRMAADRLIKNNTCTYFIGVDFTAASDNQRIYSIQIEY